MLTAQNRTDGHRTSVALAEFIRENHAALTHEVVMANGLVLDAWARELGLDAVEKHRISVAMEGSAERGCLTSEDG